MVSETQDSFTLEVTGFNPSGHTQLTFLLEILRQAGLASVSDSYLTSYELKHLLFTSKRVSERVISSSFFVSQGSPPILQLTTGRLAISY